MLTTGFVIAMSLSSPSSSCDWHSLTPVLQRLADKDQEARQALLKNVTSAKLNDITVQVDLDNRRWFRPVLEACGWPDQSVAGEQTALNAWLLAQHADMDPDFQRYAAREMKKAVLKGEAKGERLALLVDRNARINKTEQTYGMQFFDEPDAVRFLPIADPIRLDARRKEIGLPPFACYFRKVETEHRQRVLWPEGVPHGQASCGKL